MSSSDDIINRWLLQPHVAAKTTEWKWNCDQQLRHKVCIAQPTLFPLNSSGKTTFNSFSAAAQKLSRHYFLATTTQSINPRYKHHGVQTLCSGIVCGQDTSFDGCVSLSGAEHDSRVSIWFESLSTGGVSAYSGARVPTGYVQIKSAPPPSYPSSLTAFITLTGGAASPLGSGTGARRGTMRVGQLKERWHGNPS